MSDKDCCECTKEAIQDLIELQMEYDTVLKWNELIQKCLDAKEKLCDFYRNEYEVLKHTNKLWKEKAQDLEEKLESEE